MKIFLTDISDMNDDIMNKGLKLVPAYRKDKIERYRFMEDKERSLAAGLLLNYATHTSTISTVVSALPNLDNTESNFDVKRYEKSIRTESNIDISLPRM